MTKKTKRIVTKVAKNGAWAVSDIFFLALKGVGTALLIALTTGAVFSCILLIYLRTNISTGLDLNTEHFEMSESSVIYYIDTETGEMRELVTLQGTQFRRNITLDEVPEHLIQSLVAIEDHRFFRHNGVDWYRTAGAFMNMFLSMRDTFGGSTITQQLIKNLTHEDDVTVQRKLQEIFRALDFERQFTKDEILEMYLNLVYFGHGRFGIGEAAHFYFGKHVSELTLAQSAAIIGITNNPSRFSPYANRTANKERQEIILHRMFELGYIETEQDLRRAINEPLNFQRGVDETFQFVVYTWFEEAIIRDVTRDLMRKHDWSESMARMRLYNGGLRIVSTINMEMQEIVDNIYQNRENLPRVTGSTQPLQSSIIVADPYTGEVLALSGGTGRKTRNMLLNRATMTRRPPGSALKPISVFAPAMDIGLINPNTLYNDSYNVRLTGTTWMPRNADRSYSGMVTVRTALRRSLNTVPAVILDEIGPSHGFSFLSDALGFQLNPADEDYAPLAAGQLTNGATVREMTSGFTIFPNRGERVELRTYSRIYLPNGEIYIDNTVSSVRVISESTANMMTSMLYDAVVAGTGGAANLGRRMPTAGKTGTSTGSQDRWFVGFTPYYIAAVWTGFDTPARMSTQGNPAAHIWRMVMEPIHAGLETRQFDDLVIVPTRPGITTSTPSESLTTYTITLLDVNGNVIREEQRSATIGRDLTVAAPSLQYYEIVGSTQSTISISRDSGRNQVTFVYRWVGQPVDPGDPGAPPTPGPGSGQDPDDSTVPADPSDPGDSGDQNDPNVPQEPIWPDSTDTPSPPPDNDPPPDDDPPPWLFPEIPNPPSPEPTPPGDSVDTPDE